mgnify:CR=1 FL=1
MERLTCQKKIILDYLKSVKTHPSAEEIFKKVKKKLPQISLGTVYRILKNLKEKGEILEIPEKIKRYDGFVLPHAHFVCEKCGKIFDVQSECEKCEILKKKKLKVGKFKKFFIQFYGICKNCQK